MHRSLLATALFALALPAFAATTALTTTAERSGFRQTGISVSGEPLDERRLVRAGIAGFPAETQRVRLPRAGEQHHFTAVFLSGKRSGAVQAGGRIASAPEIAAGDDVFNERIGPGVLCQAGSGWE